MDTVTIVLWLVLIAGVLLFARAALRGGKQLGAFWDKRDEHRRVRESRHRP